MGAGAKQSGQVLCQLWDAGAGAQLNQDAIQTHLKYMVKHFLRLRSEAGPQNLPFFKNFVKLMGVFYQTDQSKEHFCFKQVYHKFMKFANLAADAASWSCYTVYLDTIWKT